MKKDQEKIKYLKIGARVTIFNCEYNKYEPFTATVEENNGKYSSGTKIVVRPDIELDHARFRKSGQHSLEDGDLFEVIQCDIHWQEDLFTI